LPGTTTGSFTAGTLTTTAEDREVIAAMLSLPTLLTDLRRSVERSGDQQGDKVATATASAIVSALQRAGASRSIS
jgi:hypothetical protein